MSLATEELPVGTPIVVSLGAALLAIAGLFTAVGGVQILAVAEIWTIFRYLPPLQIVLGVAAIGAAAMLYDCRWVWAILGVLISFVMVAVGVVWNVYATMNLFFSLLTWIALGLTVFAAIVTPFTVIPARRTQKARLALAGGLL